MHRISLAEGDILYREGERAELAYLILAGEMAMDRRGVTLGTGKGAVIGFSALVDRPYGATARAAGSAEVLAFTRKELRSMLRSDPDRALLIIDGIIDLVGKINAAHETTPEP